MRLIVSEQKDLWDLKYSDFEVYSVWTWVDDGGEDALVAPLASGLNPDNAEEFGSLFVKCMFVLNDGGRFPGVLSLRLRDRFVYMLSFANDDSFFDYHLILQDVTRKDLADWLNRPVSQVFPITYETSLVFDTGEPLRGQVP